MNKSIQITLIMAVILIGGSAAMFGAIELDKNNKVTDIPQRPALHVTPPQMIPELSEQLTKNHEITIKVVEIMMETYDEGDQKITALDKKLGYKINAVGLRYGFVVDDTYTVIAHFNPDLVDKKLYDLISPIESQSQISSALAGKGQVWIHYDFVNPENAKVESKTSLLKMHDGLIFGSGFYDIIQN